MGKQRAALVLVIVLLLLLLGWWGIASMQFARPQFQAAASQTEQTSATPDYIQTTLPIRVVHTASGKNHIYSGTLVVMAGCGALSSGIQATGENPAHITLLLTVTQPTTPCTAKTATSSSDFSVSFSTADKKAPIFDGVHLNVSSAPFTLVEQK